MRYLVLLLIPLMAFAQETQVYEIRDFSGGMVTDFDMVDLEQKYGSWCFNFDVNKASLRQRAGYDSIISLTSISAANIRQFYRYGVSSPNLFDVNGLVDVNDIPFITVGMGANDQSSQGYSPIYMYPKYTSGGAPDGGTWSAVWSGDYSNPSSVTGRDDFLKFPNAKDFTVYGESMRCATGSYTDGDTLWTYPLWFGYIGRYMWQGYRHPVDDFFAYDAPCFQPDTAGADDDNAQQEFEFDTLYAATGSYQDLEDGRYWFGVAYEYDGYQYSPLLSDSLWNVTTSSNDLIWMRFAIDSTKLSNRVTALIVFSTDVIATTEPYYFNHPDNPGWVVGGTTEDPLWSEQTFQFRKRIAIGATDSTELGTVQGSLSSTARKLWTVSSSAHSAKCYEVSFALFNSSFSSVTPSAEEFLGYASKEAIACPEHMSSVGNKVVIGNMIISSSTSQINERYRNMAIVSPLGQPDVYPINNYILCGIGNGSYITGIKEWNGYAAIWTNDAFELWDISSVPARVEQFAGVGCTAPRSIQITPYGIFWANNSAIYHYRGSGIPQVISGLIETELDSFAVSTSNAWQDNDNVPCFPYALSFYLPDQQTYSLVIDSTVSGTPDTSGASVWGTLPARRFYGGHDILAYNIPFQSWSKWDFAQGTISDVCKDWDGVPLFSGTHIYRIQDNVDSDMEPAKPSYAWNSGWTDFGTPYVEKELIGVEIDYKLGVTTDADTLEPDTLRCIIFRDGYASAVDTLDFYATDSLAAGGSSWRRVQYVPTSISDVTTDPSRSIGTLYDFRLSTGGALNNTTVAPEIYAIRVYYNPKSRRD